MLQHVTAQGARPGRSIKLAVSDRQMKEGTQSTELVSDRGQIFKHAGWTRRANLCKSDQVSSSLVTGNRASLLMKLD